jgi:hypothetical protein
MSTAQTTPALVPATDRKPLLRWIAGSGAVASLLAVVAIAVWPASEVDKAREDGEQFGEAVAQLYAADSPSEVDAALIEVHAAASDTREHTGDAVAAQEDALARAADGFVGMHTESDSWEADLYEYELDVALDDLESNAEEFRTTGPEVQQAFWDGYETGLNDA